MKLRQIALASAMVAAAPAFAATGSLTGLFGVPAANIVYVSGASALSGSLGAAIGKLCTGGATNVKTLTINNSTSDGRVFVCTTSAANQAAGLFQVGGVGAPFAIVKRDTNGSFEGVGPVISGTGLKTWANVNNCEDGVAPSTVLNCARDTTSTIVPTGGFSDVETAVWRGMKQTGALTQTVPSPDASITLEKGFAAQGFALMASEELYKAMQTKQKAEGRLPSSCTVGDFTPGACQPSLSKNEYASIVRADSFSYVANANITGYKDPVALTVDPINLCRRVETSGTQATSNVFFLNNSCANANPTFGAIAPKFVDFSSGTAVALTASGSVGNYDDFGGGFALFEGSGTGDTRNCVIRRNAGNNPSNVADSLGKYAIGWISLENPTLAGFKYLKLNGVSPDAYQTVVGSAEDIANSGAADGWVQDAKRRANVARGYYDAAFEFEVIYKNTAANSGIFGALKTVFSDPTVLDTAGIVVTPGTSSYSTSPVLDLVSKGTRAGNNCAPQSLTE